MDASQFQIAYDRIYSNHGWAVAEQFEDTFSVGQSFDEQNINALKYIHESLKSLCNSRVMDEYAQEELVSYMEDLMEHINNNK
jgi:hypothetical protein